MNTVRIGALDVGIVVVYFLLTIAFGLWMGRRKVKTGEDLFLGLRLRTAPEFFERRYNSGSRLFVAGINIVMILAANIVTALYAGATVISDLMGWTSAFHFNLAVLVIAVAAGLYTVLGGLRSVLWVDLMQATLLVLGGALTLILAVNAAGGVEAVLAHRDATGDNPWSIVRSWSHPYGWLPLITGAVILGVHSHCTDHDYVQRALAARSVFHSKMGAVFAGFLKVLALFIIAAPGVVAAKLIPGLDHPDQAYTRLITEYVPSGLVGLVMAGLLAAILGTVAAGLSASSAMVVFDFVGRSSPTMTEDRKVKLGRAVMIGILILCAVLAPSIKSFQGVFGYLVRIWSLLAPPVFVCVVFGIFSKRATSKGAVSTLAVGCVLGAVAFWVLGKPDLLAGLPVYLRSPLNLGFLITVVCSLVMWSLRASEPVPAAAEIVRHETDPHKIAMTTAERRTYRISLGLLLGLIFGVVLMLSPWGLAS